VQGKRIDSLIYRIESKNGNSDDEVWEFETGSIVLCEEKSLSGGNCIVAVERLEESNEQIQKSTQ